MRETTFAWSEPQGYRDLLDKLYSAIARAHAPDFRAAKQELERYHERASATEDVV